MTIPIKAEFMKKCTILLYLVLAMLFAQAQDYLISFSGTGDTTTVGSVKINNLTSGATVTLNGGDILHLTSTVGMGTMKPANGHLQIYPNPMAEGSTLTFVAPEDSYAAISVIDMNGKTIHHFSTMLAPGKHSFQITGLGQGIYFVRVTGRNYTYSTKLVSESNRQGALKIEEVSSAIDSPVNPLKSVTATINMPYKTGDRLLYKGISGQYSTIVTDVPTERKKITFNFLNCTDGDGNHYATVKIGTQVWISENLTTTKLNDGTEIPNVANDAEWLALTTPGYCWYNNDAPTYKATYGGLYNWYTVNTGKLCPEGWHVPSEAEYRTLSDYLESNTAGKIKESGTAHWFSPNTGATNETGFTALPGGERYSDFRLVGYYAFFCSTIDASTTHAGVGLIYYNSGMMDGDEYRKVCGFSVRCLKD